MIELMRQMGHDSFYVVGHDRGARLFIVDHPENVLKAAVLDIVPTYELFKFVNQTIPSGSS